MSNGRERGTPRPRKLGRGASIRRRSCGRRPGTSDSAAGVDIMMPTLPAHDADEEEPFRSSAWIHQREGEGEPCPRHRKDPPSVLRKWYRSGGSSSKPRDGKTKPAGGIHKTEQCNVISVVREESGGKYVVGANSSRSRTLRRLAHRFPVTDCGSCGAGDWDNETDNSRERVRCRHGSVGLRGSGVNATSTHSSRGWWG
ncbi:hypothetical protein MRX96_055785 [Rhipicephalus microplus]